MPNLPQITTDKILDTALTQDQEGPRADWPDRSLEDFAAWLEAKLSVIRYIRREKIASRNTGHIILDAYAYLERLPVRGVPPCPTGPFDEVTEEAELSKLLLWARDALASGQMEKGKRPGKRGRKPDSDATADRRLCEDWHAAKRQGMTRVAFAKGRGITVRDLIDAQHREKYRRKRDAE